MTILSSSNSIPGIKVQASTVYAVEDIESDWKSLQERSDCSFFQSWCWIGTWLGQIALPHKPIVIRVWSDAILVGMGLFVERDIQRRLVVRLRAMFLNEYPFDGKNMVIEYNGILADVNFRRKVLVETARHLVDTQKHCDEFYFNAITDPGNLDELSQSLGKSVSVELEQSHPTWVVSLHRAEGGMDAFLSTLSKNKRWQVRRAFRLYEEQSPLKLEMASSVEDALDYFDAMGILHTQRWNASGLPGSFSNKTWKEYHRALITKNYQQGVIQLLRISNAEGVLGYLYNFVWRKRVYSLQSGFILPDDNRLMPGYVTHALAIVFNQSEGMQEYDFMYGESRYKSSFSDKQNKLVWVLIKRRSFILLLEKIALNILRPLKNYLFRRGQ